MIVYHALDGMRVVRNTQQLINSVKFIQNNPHCEICCSNKQGSYTYGDIVLAIEGTISHMFACDVCSKVGVDGKRHSDMSTTFECDKNTFLQEEGPEAWVSDCKIKYIRIKEYAGRRRQVHYTQRYDMELINSLNIPIVIV